MVCLLRSRGAPLWLAPYTVSGTAALYNYLEPRLELNKAAVLTVKVGSTAVADGDGEEEAGADRRLLARQPRLAWHGPSTCPWEAEAGWRGHSKQTEAILFDLPMNPSRGG